MKKRIISTVIVSLLLLASCAASPSQSEVFSNVSQSSKIAENSETVNVVPTIVDKTVDGGRFSVEGFTIKGTITSSPDIGIYYDNIEELYQGSSNIIYGTIADFGYWDETAAGNTLYDIIIEKSYKGDLQPGDKITVFSEGGYCRLSKYIDIYGDDRLPDMTEQEIENSVFLKEFMGAPLVEKDKKYMVFLNGKTRSGPPFPADAYVETGTFMGRFYYKDAETLMRHTPENEPNFYQDPVTRTISKQEFTLPELEAEIAACAEAE